VSDQVEAFIRLDGEGTLTTHQLSDFLNVKRDTLKSWRQKGTGPAYLKANRKVLYPKPSVRAWLKKRWAKNTAQAEANRRRQLIEQLSHAHSDFPTETLAAALDMLPDHIGGVASWRWVQFMQLNYAENGALEIKNLVLRETPALLEGETSAPRLEDAADWKHCLGAIRNQNGDK